MISMCNKSVVLPKKQAKKLPSGLSLLQIHLYHPENMELLELKPKEVLWSVPPEVLLSPHHTPGSYCYLSCWAAVQVKHY